MKKKLLIIIPIVIILIILFVLLFFRFSIYNLKVEEVTDNEIYAKEINGDDWYYSFDKNNATLLGIDFSDIKEGDNIKIYEINTILATSDGMSYFYEEQPCIRIEGLKIIKAFN